MSTGTPRHGSLPEPDGLTALEDPHHSFLEAFLRGIDVTDRTASPDIAKSFDGIRLRVPVAPHKKQANVSKAAQKVGEQGSSAHLFRGSLITEKLSSARNPFAWLR
jgi:hypothetical protein